MARDPTALMCLQCQLIGRRRLMCSRRDECRSIPHMFILGPVLLVGWIATVVTFILAVK